MRDSNGYDLLAAIEHIDPSALDYGEWIAVGAALHHEGYDMEDWREWSRRDAARFNERDFERRWHGFGHNTGEPVTGGTIVKMARDRGWEPTSGKRHGALAWDAVIGGREAKAARAKAEKAAATAADEPALIDPSMVGEFDADVRPLYGAGRERDELRDFLDAMFDDDEIIGYVPTAEEDPATGRMVLSRGVYSRTAGEVKAQLGKGLENALGTLNGHTGAWVRVNPLDGQGVGNANVTAYRHVLLESDEMPVGKFAAIVKQLNIPVSAWVHSGGKSLHALVRIDAADAREYRERVELLFARCEKNGIAVDRANKNPSRLCRMPGAVRDGRRQFLAGLASGAGSWAEWDEWYINETDELPDAEPLDIDPDGDRPKLPDPLITGVLRTHDKMLLAGPSKAGKSFALMELCAALATGGTWMGWKCKQSRVLYVNLELTAASCRARFYDVFHALGMENNGNVTVWDMKGKGGALSKLKKPLKRRAMKAGAEVIVIDPAYKIMMGDENNARDISEFTNTLDEIIEETGCSLIYCHHHSKGFQGEKRSIDRASGSGVFGRDADAIVDMIEIEPDEGARNGRVSIRQCAAWHDACKRAGVLDEYLAAVGSDGRQVEQRCRETAEKLLDSDAFNEAASLIADIGRRRQAISAWRIDATLREFEKPAPVTCWFDHPVHVVDPSLKNAREVGAEQPKPKGEGGRAKKSTAERKNEAIAEAVQSCREDGEEPTRQNVFDRLHTSGKKPSKSTFDKWTTEGKADFEWCEWKCQERDGEHVLVYVGKASE